MNATRFADNSYKDDQGAEHQPASPLPIGRVVAQSASGVILRSHMKAGLAMGDRLRFGGKRQALGVITGFETPFHGDHSGADEVVLVDVQLAGCMRDDGNPRRGLVFPPMGAEVYTYKDDLEAHLTQLARPLTIGEHEGCAIAIDQSRLLGQRLSIVGDEGSGTSSTLAVIARTLLLSSFPGRQIILDTDNRFGQSFGRGAVTIDASQGLVPLGHLTAREQRTLTDILGQQIDDDPRASLFNAPSLRGVSRADVLQRIFRVPDGRPPASLIRFGQVDPRLKSLALQVLCRLAEGLTEASRGGVPVLFHVDRCHQYEDEILSLPRAHMGFVTAGEAGGKEAAGYRLLHRAAAISRGRDGIASDEGDLMQQELGRTLPFLRDGEALLVDPDRPWPMRVAVSPLPAKAVPEGDSLSSQQAPFPDRATLLAAIEDMWR